MTEPEPGWIEQIRPHECSDETELTGAADGLIAALGRRLAEYRAHVRLDRVDRYEHPGRRKAEGLVVSLEDHPVERILCSPALRCHQTVQPLAGDRSLQLHWPKGSTWLLQRDDRRQVRGRILPPSDSRRSSAVIRTPQNSEPERR